MKLKFYAFRGTKRIVIDNNEKKPTEIKKWLCPFFIAGNIEFMMVTKNKAESIFYNKTQAQLCEIYLKENDYTFEKLEINRNFQNFIH
jgi:hypothetical protein